MGRMRTKQHAKTFYSSSNVKPQLVNKEMKIQITYSAKRPWRPLRTTVFVSSDLSTYFW